MVTELDSQLESRRVRTSAIVLLRNNLRQAVSHTCLCNKVI